MGTGYVRQAAAQIAPDELVSAAPLNLEFNAIKDAFAGATGHSHDGTLGEGPPISLTDSVAGILPLTNGGTGVASLTELLTTLRTAGVWTKDNDGPGSTLDADTVDGVHGTSILRKDIADTKTNALTINTTGSDVVPLFLNSAGNTKLQFQRGGLIGGYLQSSPNTLRVSNETSNLDLISGQLNWTGSQILLSGGGDNQVRLNSSNRTIRNLINYDNSIGFINGANTQLLQVFDTGAVSTSQLGDLKTYIDTPRNAATLGGVSPSSFVRNDNGAQTISGGNLTVIGSITSKQSGANTGYISLVNGNPVNSGYVEFFKPDGTRKGYIGYGDSSSLDIVPEAGITFKFVGPDPFVNSNVIWHAGNDGAGSGLDADFLDGIQGNQYARIDVGNTFSQRLHVNTSAISADDVVRLIGASNPYIELFSGGERKAYLQGMSTGEARVGNVAGQYLSLPVDSVNLLWNGNTIWNAGNFNPANKADKNDGTTALLTAGSDTVQRTWTAQSLATLKYNQPTTMGAVGTYALLFRPSNSTTNPDNGPIPGSELSYAHFWFDNPSAFTDLRNASGLRNETNDTPNRVPGTWRLMSVIGAYHIRPTVGLYLRIA